MRRTPVLAILAGLPCLLAVFIAGPAAADLRQGRDPYGICRDRGLSRADFNRCISDVYIEELRQAGTVGVLERTLGGHASAGGSALLHATPCLFNPATGRYQECHLSSAGDQCLQYAGPCVP